jgi:hypothetical protein
VSIQQTLIKALGAEEAPPPPILGLVLTSGLYPVVVEGDAVSASAGLLAANTYIFFDNAVEQVYARAGLQSTALNATIVYTSYSNWPVEDVYSRAGFQAGTLTSTIVFTNYSNWPVEDVYARSALNSAILTTTIAFVTNAMQPEDVYARATLQSAILA